MFKKYCVGFIFDHDLDRLWLIRKNRPDWQAGLLNGIGGKVEQGETWLECMEREAKEEAGYESTFWSEFCTLKYPDAEVHFFVSVVMNPDIELPHTCEEERIETWPVGAAGMYEQCVPNLRWLIPAALNYITDSYPVYITGESVRR